MTRTALYLLAAALAAAAGASLAQGNPPKQRAITKHWQCENGREVTINYHPYRIREPAWLTYLGNRHEVARKRVDKGIAASTPDGKVQWHEIGSNAMLQYAGLVDQPMSCSLTTAGKSSRK